MQLTESLATFPRDRDNGPTDSVRGYHGEVIQNTPGHNVSGAHMEPVLIKSVYLTIFRGHNSINKTTQSIHSLGTKPVKSLGITISMVNSILCVLPTLV